MAANDWGGGFDAETDFLCPDLGLGAAQAGAKAGDGGHAEPAAGAAPMVPKRIAAAALADVDSDDDDADFAKKYAVEDDDDGDELEAAPAGLPAVVIPALVAPVQDVGQPGQALAAGRDDQALKGAAEADDIVKSAKDDTAVGSDVVPPGRDASSPTSAAAASPSPSPLNKTAVKPGPAQEEPRQEDPGLLRTDENQGQQADQLQQPSERAINIADGVLAASAEASQPMAGVEGPGAVSGSVGEDAISADVVMATADEGPSLPTSSTATDAPPAPVLEAPEAAVSECAPAWIECCQPSIPPAVAAAVPATVALAAPKPQSPRIKALRLQIAPVGPTVSPQQAAAIVASKQQFQAAAPQRRPLQLMQPPQQVIGSDPTIGEAAAQVAKPTLGPLRLAATTPLAGAAKTVASTTAPASLSTLRLAPLQPLRSPAPAVLGAMSVQQTVQPAGQAATPGPAKLQQLGVSQRQGAVGAAPATVVKPLAPANGSSSAAPRNGGSGKGAAGTVGPNKAPRLQLSIPSARATVESKQPQTAVPLKTPAPTASKAAVAAAAAATALALPASTVSKLAAPAPPTAASAKTGAPTVDTLCPPAPVHEHQPAQQPQPLQQQASEPMDVDSCSASARAAAGGRDADTAGCSGAGVPAPAAPSSSTPAAVPIPSPTAVSALPAASRPAAAAPAPAPQFAAVTPGPNPLLAAEHAPQLLQSAAPVQGAPRSAAAKMADAMERLQGMLLAMQSLEDEVVSVRLGAALEAGRLARLDNPMIARRVKALTDRAAATAAATAAAAVPAPPLPLAPAAGDSGLHEPLPGHGPDAAAGLMAGPVVVLPGPIHGPLSA